MLLEVSCFKYKHYVIEDFCDNRVESILPNFKECLLCFVKKHRRILKGQNHDGVIRSITNSICVLLFIERWSLYNRQTFGWTCLHLLFVCRAPSERTLGRCVMSINWLILIYYINALLKTAYNTFIRLDL